MKRFFTCAFRILALAYVTILLFASLFPKATDGGTSYLFNLVMFSLYSFPFYCVFLEMGMTMRYVFGSVAKSVERRVVHTLRLILSCGILLTLLNISDYFGFALIMALAWCAFAVLELVAFRRGGTRMDEDKIS